LTYLEFKVDPVAATWHQEMIDNPNAKFCFVFDARNVFRELSKTGNEVISYFIKRVVEEYCENNGVDTWYYPQASPTDSCHLLYTSTSSWIVMLRMTKSTEPNFDNYLLRHLDHVEERNDQSID
jgi:hypothetical protein